MALVALAVVATGEGVIGKGISPEDVIPPEGKVSPCHWKWSWINRWPP